MNHKMFYSHLILPFHIFWQKYHHIGIFVVEFQFFLEVRHL